MNSFRNIIKKSVTGAYRSLLTKSVQERLGYPKKTKLLIIHADDLGLCKTENNATIKALEKGMVNSSSIMVPCRGFKEAAEWGRNHPETDLGLHLTLTSEWNAYKWGPVLPADEVKTLVSDVGFFLPDKAGMVKKASDHDIEKEARSQIRAILDAGLDLTHIDSHMFVAFAPRVMDIYRKLGKEFRVPVMLTGDIPVKHLFSKEIITLEKLYYAKVQDFNTGLDKFYSNVLNSIKPGLNCILIHVAFDNEEMKEFTGTTTGFGSAWRQADFDFFTSDECRKLLDENNIRLITWREVRNKLLR